MQKLWKAFSQKRIAVIFLIVALAVTTILPAVAANNATNSKDGLEVSIQTDKESYKKGEEVKVTIVAKNNGTELLKNVRVELDLPDGIKLAEGSDTTIKLGDLKAQETVEKEVPAMEISSTETTGETSTGDTAMPALFVILAIIAVIAGVVAGKKKVKSAGVISVIVLGILGLSASINMAYAATISGEFTVSKVIKVDGKEKTISALVKYGDEVTTEETTEAEKETTTEQPTTDTNKPSEDNNGEYSPNYDRVSVHDPSIIKDPETDTYYIFGSHMAWAKSTDLMNWTTFTNNINRDFRTMFAAEAEWAAKASNSYDVSGNLWAPDVIWNEDMGKWCMYMSINGPLWNSTISLLTADSLDGDWTYVGPVIQSGMTNGFGVTFDYTKVTGETTVNSRYTDAIRNGNPTREPHAIDPCVTYDAEGNLWMSYGSWSGGIGMIQLDKNTGLRDYSVTYELDETTLTDPYTGYKIAGGNQVSGEASYIEQIGDYYYLFMSYGGLVANGGYNMRVFRSESITGPYVDENGDYARYKLNTNVIGSTGAGNTNGTVGIKLMSQYKWNYQKYAQVAQGHNSAFVDEDGKAYVVYHTRTNDGTEGHSVRVHQLFVNEDDWLVAAPFEYCGETLGETTYTAEQVAGTYEVILHEQNINYTSLEYAAGKDLVLKADGTVSGDFEGTWSTDGTNVTIIVGEVTYKGVLVEQYQEGIMNKSLCFTTLGTNEKMLWGCKNSLSGKEAIDAYIATGKFTIPSSTIKDISFITEGLYGTTISYESQNTDVLTNDGKVTRQAENTEVVVIVTFANGDETITKEYTVTVIGKGEAGDRILVGSYYKDSPINLANATEGTYQFANPFNKNVTNGLQIYNGVSIEFDVEGTGSYLSNILSFYGSGRLYFTGGSYLGYNATGGYFDANVSNGDAWAAGTDYIQGEARVRIDLTGTGFTVYVNGEKAYDEADLAAGTIAGGKDIVNYANVLLWLNNTAETLNFGWGSWWSDSFNGTIANVELYANYVEEVDTTGYAYYEDYSSGDLTEWTSPNISGSIQVGNDGDEKGNYLNIVAGTDSGNRTAYAIFKDEAKVSGKYTISVDTALTAGVLTQRSKSTFAILGTDAAGYKNNDAVTAGYILKLQNNAPEGTAANQVNTENQTKWYINDTDTYVDIPVGEWVNITAEVDTTAGTALVTITKGDTELYKDTVTINGTGELMGLQVVRGRGVGTAKVDNVTVKVTEAGTQPDVVPLGATVEVTGVAYPDKDSNVTVTFTADRDLVSTDIIKIDGQDVATGVDVGLVKVDTVTYEGTTATVELTVKAMEGWHSIDGSYDVTLMSGTTQAANTTIEYTLEMSEDTDYTAIVPNDNAQTKAYYKVVGTKMYLMTVMNLPKIHCDGMLGFGWWNGVCSELYLNMDSVKYSIGSHVYAGQYANPIGWGDGVDVSLITADNVVRGYMALGTFDNDDDTDKGAILLNVVDLANAGYTTDTLAGKTITFSGYAGPNDGGTAFVAIDAETTYTIE